MKTSITEIEQEAQELRNDVLKMFYKVRTGHMAPALSCVEILSTLYNGVVSQERKFTEDRDRVILSKGHACAALYAALAQSGYIPREMLNGFYQADSLLAGHPTSRLLGVELSAGSLGHGICFATGVAKAAKFDNKPYRVYVVIGDGESEEGSVWEAAMFASQQKLDNLTVILDNNRLQGSCGVDTIMDLSLIPQKWKAFGWNVITVDGHNVEELFNAFEFAKDTKGVPSIIVAKTTKGKGVVVAENNVLWHNRVPSDDEWETVFNDMNISNKEREIV